MKSIYEKAGLFYLGKDVDTETFDLQENLTLIKNKWLTTHAAIIGMTGSGKTGLGVALIEEAAMDNIPVVVIDPKGDMGDLCLIDPEFSPQRFEPWVRQEAEAKGEDAAMYAQQVATMWEDGIAKWGQDRERVARYDAVEKVIYTPGSSAGVSVDILSSFDVPPEAIMNDPDAFASYVKSTVTSLLSLIGESSDTVESHAYILIAKIVSDAWRRGESLSIEALISRIMQPPFKKIGVLGVERFYPSKERMKLAGKLNALLASPGFEAWLTGEPLDIQRMLYDEQGKARIAIFSIAHLNDDERMFFVTLLLNRYIAWMRRQSGTSRLRAMLYMDEIFGFFPPNANPPSKEPMLLLLKQARAFGVGVVLSTQNPVDLDYKGLANIGTWFIGRLQTKQDIERIIDGMQGKVGDSLSKEQIKETLAKLEQRVFFLRSAHLDALRLFSTRWVMSYLKGPLQRDEIAVLMQPYKERLSGLLSEDEPPIVPTEFSSIIEPLDPSIPVFYEPPLQLPAHYRPSLQAKVTVRFFNQRKGLDERQEEILALPLKVAMHAIDWQAGEATDEDFTLWMKEPPRDAVFEDVPDVVRRDRALRQATRELKEYLYTTRRIEMWRCVPCKLHSRPGESYAEFMVRIDDWLEERKEEAIEKLQERYAKKEKRLQERIARAKERVEKEKSDATASIIDTGIAILGALFGRTTPTKIGRTLSRGSKVLKEHGDMSRAEERLALLLDERDALEAELEAKIDAIDERYDRDRYPVESVMIAPRKSDIDVTAIAVAWQLK